VYSFAAIREKSEWETADMHWLFESGVTPARGMNTDEDKSTFDFVFAHALLGTSAHESHGHEDFTEQEADALSSM